MGKSSGRPRKGSGAPAAVPRWGCKAPRTGWVLGRVAAEAPGQPGVWIALSQAGTARPRQARLPSRRRDGHSAAPPSPFSRCINSDGEGMSSKGQSRQGSPAAACTAVPARPRLRTAAAPPSRKGPVRTPHTLVLECPSCRHLAARLRHLQLTSDRVRDKGAVGIRPC